jgi:hypothetical protein
MPMSSPDPYRPPRPDSQPGAPSGCWSVFVVLLGIAFLLVGLLFTAVSGFCGYAVLQSGGAAARDFGGILAAGFVIGIFLCIAGYFMLRGRSR